MPRSSTSSSEPVASAAAAAGATKSAWRVGLAELTAVLLIVLLADIALRASAPFQLYNDWEHQQLAWKEDTYRRFVKDQGVDVLLLGSSVIMNLDARRLGRQTGARVFNGGVGSGNPTAMGAVLQHMYLPLAKPKLVVYAVSARDLRDTGDPYAQPPFYSHRMRRLRAATWQERAEVTAERYSYLFRVRRQLRDWALRGEPPRSVLIRTDDNGSRKHTGHGLIASLRGRAEFPADYAYRSRYEAYRVDLQHGHARQLVSLVERNRSLGIATILVNVPLSPAAMTLFDHRDADYLVYLNALSEIAREANVKLYDAHSALRLSNSHFNDADHMGLRGDDKTERYLAPIIARHLASPR